MDKAQTKELLNFILKSIKLIKDRFKYISNSDDFITSDEGIEKLDSISMRLQSIGEALKQVDKRDKNFLEKVEDRFYWSKIIKTRDLLSHHYIEIDADIIYQICKYKLDELENNINKLLDLLK